MGIFLLVLVLFVSACQPQATGPKISVEGAWARSSPSMAGAGAAYAVISNQGNEADRLISVSSDAAKTAEVHESYMDKGMMMMRPVQGGLEIPASGKVELKPGGYHIMLINLAKPLEAGAKITIVLKFEKAGEITVEAEIKNQ